MQLEFGENSMYEYIHANMTRSRSNTAARTIQSKTFIRVHWQFRENQIS